MVTVMQLPAEVWEGVDGETVIPSEANLVKELLVEISESLSLGGSTSPVVQQWKVNFVGYGDFIKYLG